MKLWHALHREVIGAFRSVRYDLDIHRATKLAGAFTEEFEPTGRSGAAPSRLVPLAGVGLLLVGGAAGAVLAIGGGMAALGADDPLPFGERPAAAAPGGPGTAPQPGLSGAARPLTPHRPGTRTEPAPGAPPATAPGGVPVPEASTLPVSPAPTDPDPGASADPDPDPDPSQDPGQDPDPEPSSEPPGPSPSVSGHDESGDEPSDEPRRRYPRSGASETRR